MEYPALRAGPAPFPLEFRVSVEAVATELAAGKEPGGYYQVSMVPLGFVFELTAYFAHGAVCLGLGGETLHHAGYVQVLDDQHAVAVHQVSGHLVEGVLPKSSDTPVAFVDPALGFPPATGAYCPAGLGPLPAAESSLHLVVCPGVLVGIAVGIGGVGIDAGIYCSLGACISS